MNKRTMIKKKTQQKRLKASTEAIGNGREVLSWWSGVGIGGGLGEGGRKKGLTGKIPGVGL